MAAHIAHIAHIGARKSLVPHNFLLLNTTSNTFLQKILIDIRKVPHFDTRFEPKNCLPRLMRQASKKVTTLLPAHLQNGPFCGEPQRV